MNLNQIESLLSAIVKSQQANEAVIKQAEVISIKAWKMAEVIGDPRDMRRAQ